ncbi:MAG: prepilin-type N-terminal cleavage/methylation domain-containing protein [Proteobacteria bacterium]|nr:prepilin-type N-terminal cleavage/methylation domain-containing protein [Pseudomonadota bacterium]
MRHSPASAGFTLLEAIVALTVMALALIPLITFIAQSSDQLMRAADANERSIVGQSVLALMDPINPMVEPEGILPLDDEISVSWRSDTIVPPNDGAIVGTLLPGFRVGFYGVNVTVKRGERPWFEFQMRKVGYQNMRGSSTDPFGMAP